MPLESFTIGKVIGKGSYGEVYLAKHRKDRKQVSFYEDVTKSNRELDSIVTFIQVSCLSLLLMKLLLPFFSCNFSML